MSGCIPALQTHTLNMESSRPRSQSPRTGKRCRPSHCTPSPQRCTHCIRPMSDCIPALQIQKHRMIFCCIQVPQIDICRKEVTHYCKKSLRIQSCTPQTHYTQLLQKCTGHKVQPLCTKPLQMCILCMNLWNCTTPPRIQICCMNWP